MRKHWKNYLKEVLTRINEIQTLPSEGLLAGGSLANLFWEKHTNNEAVINDIDIFRVDKLEENIGFVKADNFKNTIKMVNTKRERAINTKNKYGEEVDDREYSHINSVVKSGNHIKIMNSKYDGKINNISFNCNVYSPLDLLHTFDINCTQIAYDISTKKLYYTEDFDMFMKTGQLKITNANTPCHTSIRLVKKQKDLNADLDYDEEFGLSVMTMNEQIEDYRRMFFSDKYAKLFNENMGILGNYFTIKRKEYSIPSYKNVAVKNNDHELLNKLQCFVLKYDYKGYETLSTLKEEELFKKEVLCKDYNLFTLIPLSHRYDLAYDDNMDILNTFTRLYMYGKTIDELVYYYRNIRKYNIKKGFWTSVLGKFWHSNKKYITGINFTDANFEKKQILIVAILETFPVSEIPLSDYDFEEQYRMCKTILKNVIENNNSFFYYYFYTGKFNFNTEEERDFQYNITKIKNRKHINIMKEKYETKYKGNMDDYVSYIDRIKKLETLESKHQNLMVGVADIKL